jgi:hypothetical protein
VCPLWKSKKDVIIDPLGKKSGRGKFAGMIIPNVFGPLAINYNSVVATFCHKVTCEIPTMRDDGDLKLIYVCGRISC